LPVSDWKNDRETANPPGSAGELKVAVTPLLVLAKIVDVPITSLSKLKVAVVAAAGEAKVSADNAANAHADTKLVFMDIPKQICRA